jgi:hypothetical protein
MEQGCPVAAITLDCRRSSDTRTKEQEMNATAETSFDIDALKQAFEASDVDKVLEFYSSDLEHIEIDAGAPPKSPRTSDFEHIGNALRGPPKRASSWAWITLSQARTAQRPRLHAFSLTAAVSCPTRSTISRVAGSFASSTFR